MLRPTVIEATTGDLDRAVRNRDAELPRTDRGFLDAALLQLGICCLDNRTVRLMLPNGRVLIVQLE